MKVEAPLPRRALAWLLIAACAAPFPARVAPAGTTSQAVQVASSAQLVLDTQARSGKLVLWITRTRDHTPVTGAGNVTVRLDGHAVNASAQQSAYIVSTDDLHGRHSIEVVVAHDGIRELLSGTVTLPKAPTTLETLQKHAGWAWWVLNIAVALLAARLIMRRKKSP